MYYPSIIAFVSVLLFSVPVTPIPVNTNVTVLEERGGMHGGTATYFAAGLGACGFYDNDNVPLVALSARVFNKKYCNRHVEIKYPRTGKTMWVPVRDSCPGCDPSHLDLSPAVWHQLGADQSLGVIQIQFEGPK